MGKELPSPPTHGSVIFSYHDWKVFCRGESSFPCSFFSLLMLFVLHFEIFLPPLALKYQETLTHGRGFALGKEPPQPSFSRCWGSLGHAALSRTQQNTMRSFFIPRSSSRLLPSHQCPEKSTFASQEDPHLFLFPFLAVQTPVTSLFLQRQSSFCLDDPCFA